MPSITNNLFLLVITLLLTTTSSVTVDNDTFSSDLKLNHIDNYTYVTDNDVKNSLAYTYDYNVISILIPASAQYEYDTQIPAFTYTYDAEIGRIQQTCNVSDLSYDTDYLLIIPPSSNHHPLISLVSQVKNDNVKCNCSFTITRV